MVEMIAARNTISLREQFAAIAQLRWNIFTHSLRTVRGRMEMVSWIFIGFGYSVLGVGGTIGLGVATWYLVSHNQEEWLAVPLWLIFLVWQLLPVMATAFTENFDASNFLRFPLSYRSYFVIRMAYGALDPTTIIGCLWLAGMALGAGAAAPSLFLWVAIVLGAFAALNILLGRMIFSWLERWLARRKSREILGIFFFLFVISVQFISPLTQLYLHRYGRSHQPPAFALATQLVAVQRFLPPGLASSAVSLSVQSHFALALGALVLLCIYSSAFLGLLNIRLVAQFRGENLSEAPAPAAARSGKEAVSAGWDLGGGLSGAVAAMFEKEFHYLSRSGPMLFPLVMPLVILVIFRFSFLNVRHGSNFLESHAGLAFPIGAAYALLILSGFSYNCFGTEGAGVQFYYMSPVRFREVLLAKNLAMGAIVLLEMVLVWVGVAFLFSPPSLGITMATLVGALFAGLAAFTVGNLMSLYSPRKIDWAAFGRQRASGLTALAALGVQAASMGLAAIAVLVALYFHQTWPATVLLLLFAAGALRGYTYVLGRIDSIAISRRESLISELCRAL